MPPTKLPPPAILDTCKKKNCACITTGSPKLKRRLAIPTTYDKIVNEARSDLAEALKKKPPPVGRQKLGMPWKRIATRRTILRELNSHGKKPHGTE
jgi:hypothetical protein